MERMLARVFRESGARVRFNAFLKDMNVGVSATDDRRIEVLAQDLPCFGGSEAGGAKRQLAFAKAREVPPAMKWPVVLAWERRWTRMLATTCAVAFAASLVAPSEQCETWCRTGGEAPTVAGLLDDDPR